MSRNISRDSQPKERLACLSVVMVIAAVLCCIVFISIHVQNHTVYECILFFPTGVT